MDTFAEVARELRPNGHWSRRAEFVSMLVVIPLRGLHILVFIFWSWCFLQSLA